MTITCAFCNTLHSFAALYIKQRETSPDGPLTEDECNTLYDFAEASLEHLGSEIEPSDAVKLKCACENVTGHRLCIFDK